MPSPARNRQRLSEGSDCTNFASRALHKGGGAHTEYGSIVDVRRSPWEWWRKSKSDMTYSWSAGNNFAHFMANEDSVTWVRTISDIVPGDITLLDYARRSSNLDHAGVIYYAGSTTGSVLAYQHSGKYRNTTLSAIMKRRKGVTAYIAHVTPHWY